MNKTVYLNLSTLGLREIVKYEFWYNYIKPKYDEKYLTVYIKTDDIYKGIAEDTETRFNTSNYELDRLLPKGKNKNLIRLMKNELSGKILKGFVGLRVKTYSYLIDNDSEDKKEKGTKKCVITRKFKFQNYKNV